MLARRLLLAALGGGSFVAPEYAMTPAEIAWWQGQAALLDPDAYEFVHSTGTPTSRTVPDGEFWYLVSGWKLYKLGGTTPLWYHRQADVRDEPLLLPEGTVISTSNVSGSHMLLCKPSLVISGDSRYTDDPRALWFARDELLRSLEIVQVGVSATDNSNVSSAFTGGFTDGLVRHVSAHDMAWVGLEYSNGTSVLNLQNEISDTERIRFATSALLPFKRATFPEVQARGATQSEGASVVGISVLDGTGW